MSFSCSPRPPLPHGVSTFGREGRAYMGCALRSRTNTTSRPVLVTNILLVRCGEYPSHQKRSYVLMMPLGKIKTSILKANKVLFPPLLPVKNSCIFSTISAKRNQISYSNRQKPCQVLLAGKPSASKRKQDFFSFKDSIHPHGAKQHLFH